METNNTLVEFLANIMTSITGFWTTLAAHVGGQYIVWTAAGCAVIGYAISGLWRMFSKRKRGGRG